MLEAVRRVPYRVAVPFAVLLAVAPFGRTPHVVEKARMLMAGTLTRPIDMFDPVFHASGAVVLIARIAADLFSGKGSAA
ncbi:hypothetical protein FJZ36_11610 [Candidatus Poribacteria bacterium]|nr:hypothetical protein [Candidatus Poribacteria bacterium]